MKRCTYFKQWVLTGSLALLVSEAEAEELHNPNELKNSQFDLNTVLQLSQMASNLKEKMSSESLSSPFTKIQLQLADDLYDLSQKYLYELEIQASKMDLTQAESIAYLESLERIKKTSERFLKNKTRYKKVSK